MLVADAKHQILAVIPPYAAICVCATSLEIAVFQGVDAVAASF